jgi:hypothetical protein
MAIQSVVCPFCPLCCDDVEVGGDEATIGVDCTLARAQFAAAIDCPPPRIGSQIFDHVDWEAFAARLDLQRPPLVMIHGATIEESKEITRLAAEGSLRVRLMEPDWLAAMERTIARDGVIAATLGDVCSHAEFIWMVGEFDSLTPRLRERLQRTGADLEHTPTLSLSTLAEFNALTEHRQGRARVPAQNFEVSSDRILAHIRRSRYTAIVLGAAPFERDCEAVGSESLVRLIGRWNQVDWTDGAKGEPVSQRAVVLRMTPDQNLRGVMRWTSNMLPQHGLSQPPVVAVSIGARPVGDDSPVRLQIGGPDPGDSVADAYLPASTPGVQFAGTTIRGDGSVTLPLAGWTDMHHPCRIDVLRRLIGDLAG